MKKQKQKEKPQSTAEYSKNIQQVIDAKLRKQALSEARFMAPILLPLNQMQLLKDASIIELKKLFKDNDPLKGDQDFFCDSLQMINSAYGVIESQESQFVERKSAGLDQNTRNNMALKFCRMKELECVKRNVQMSLDRQNKANQKREAAHMDVEEIIKQKQLFEKKKLNMLQYLRLKREIVQSQERKLQRRKDGNESLSIDVDTVDDYTENQNKNKWQKQKSTRNQHPISGKSQKNKQLRSGQFMITDQTLTIKAPTIMLQENKPSLFSKDLASEERQNSNSCQGGYKNTGGCISGPPSQHKPNQVQKAIRPQTANPSSTIFHRRTLSGLNTAQKSVKSRQSVNFICEKIASDCADTLAEGAETRSAMNKMHNRAVSQMNSRQKIVASDDLQLLTMLNNKLTSDGKSVIKLVNATNEILNGKVNSNSRMSDASTIVGLTSGQQSNEGRNMTMRLSTKFKMQLDQLAELNDSQKLLDATHSESQQSIEQEASENEKQLEKCKRQHAALETRYELTSKKIDNFILNQSVLFHQTANEKALRLQKHKKQIAMHRRGRTENY